MTEKNLKTDLIDNEDEALEINTVAKKEVPSETTPFFKKEVVKAVIFSAVVLTITAVMVVLAMRSFNTPRVIHKTEKEKVTEQQYKMITPEKDRIEEKPFTGEQYSDLDKLLLKIINETKEQKKNSK